MSFRRKSESLSKIITRQRSRIQFGMTMLRRPFLFLIRIYQKTISPDHGIFKSLFPHGYCRFYPTCSEYGYQAIKKYGLVIGTLKTIWRILRCNPWNNGGVDFPCRSVTFSGKVLLGQGKGEQVGAKTANLDVSLAVGLAPGLYECVVVILETSATYDGLLYYGYNSLSQKNCLEVHLLNFSGDLYGKELTVTTKKFLRPPEKFDSVGKLKKQILADLKISKDL